MSMDMEALLRDALPHLTAPDGESRSLWRGALKETAYARERKRLVRATAAILSRHRLIAAAAAILCVLGITVLAAMVNLSSPGFLASDEVTALSAPTPMRAAPGSELGGSRFASSAADGSGDLGAPDRASVTRGVGGGQEWHQVPAATGAESTSRPEAGARFIVHKANIDLRCTDVRTTFLKVGALLSEAQGEFVETSELRGEPGLETASMTLRIAVPRLSSILNSLRELGAVIGESRTGEDVTTAVVDLEARIANEKRIEDELLRLLDTRRDAPLADVLEVRKELHEVRFSIERLEGQRQRLARLIDLATVLVILHPEKDTATTVRSGDSIGKVLSDHVERSLRSGLLALVETVAWIVRVAIGGLIWWVLLAALIIAVRASRRTAERRAVAAPR